MHDTLVDDLLNTKCYNTKDDMIQTETLQIQALSITTQSHAYTMSMHIHMQDILMDNTDTHIP